MKNVLINSYEGSVLIKHIPNSVKREDIIDIARVALKPHQTYLNNVGYVVNPNMLDLEEDIKDGFIITAEYVDISAK